VALLSLFIGINALPPIAVTTQNNAQEARPWRALSSGTTAAYLSGSVKSGTRRWPAISAVDAAAA